jgi:signal transduction histidine kinase
MLASRRLLFRRLRGPELVAVDGVFAAALAAVCVYAATEDPLGPEGVREPAWVSVLAGLLVVAPVAVRRLWPLPVLGAVIAATAGALLSGIIPDYASFPAFAALALALYTVGVTVPRRRSVAALALCLTVVAALLIAVLRTGLGDATTVGEVGFVASLVAAAWVLGRATRERRAFATRVAEQATHRAVVEERLRIARELHDVVAHSMSVIAVKAAVGNHVAEADPREARAALGVIEATSRGALLELRRALGMLREHGSYAPAPGLADLPRLAEQASAGGVHVDLAVTALELPDGVGLSVFRIVQEALTNVVKHAAPARCRVEVDVDPTEVRIAVTDDGRRATGPAADGHGLIGIRERVSMYGGALTTGPGPDGGFRLAARLPYASHS